ncbi:MAG TPA: endonuclease/exonuclease/phosphatase family protein [Phycisphaerae bacterium]|nr:endonuclease/exonuclease/phosphatase family protein [Phycisphaerae bacterium]HRR83651.1 endonuclease/exonuclease/phosphatase family protein [Phycisphaerae bacterium]
MIAWCRRNAGSIADQAAAVLAVYWVVALLIRLTVRDSFVPASTIFYATPIIVLAGIAAIACLLLLVRRRRRMGWLCLGAAVACMAWWHCATRFTSATASDGKGVRVLAWNTAGRALERPGVIDQIRRVNPDIIAMNEAGPATKERIAQYAAAFPGYNISTIYHGMILITRGELVEHECGDLADRAWYKHTSVLVGGVRLSVIQPEIRSNPFYSRAAAIQTLTRLACSMSNEPTIIIGDFNTPADSIHLRGLRQDFLNAFEAAGKGHYATWPIPCPVLAIDQAWVSRLLRVTRCELGWTWKSDHRPLICEIQLAN